MDRKFVDDDGDYVCVSKGRNEDIVKIEYIHGSYLLAEDYYNDFGITDLEERKGKHFRRKIYRRLYE